MNEVFYLLLLLQFNFCISIIFNTDTAKVNGILSNAKESNGLKNDDITNEDGLEPNLRKKPVPKATSQLNDVTDGFKRSSSPKSPPPLPPTKKSTITSKSRNSIDSPNVRKSIESQTESFKNNNRQIGAFTFIKTIVCMANHCIDLFCLFVFFFFTFLLHLYRFRRTLD